MPITRSHAQGRFVQIGRYVPNPAAVLGIILINGALGTIRAAGTLIRLL